MKDDPVRPGTGSSSGEVRPWQALARPWQHSIMRDLEELRDCVLQRLSSLEALARRHSGPTSGEISRLELTLKQKISELEEARRHLRTEIEMEDSKWKQSLAQLEDDRRLLAEAWERLERERIDLLAVNHGSPRSGSARVRPGDTAGIASPPRSTTHHESNNPVAETILRQFQSLCNDVRRNADGRCSPR